MQVTVSRHAHFNAAHRLHNPALSQAQNQEVFGKCNNQYYHGHNYELIVSVTGPIDANTGYVVDMKWLSEIVQDKIETRFDHKNLNIEVDEFQSLNPTAENIAVVIWNILRKEIKDCLTLKVTLYETPRNFVEYSGN